MTNYLTQHLSIKDKVKLFKKLYTELSGYGCGGDTELAHINSYEAQLLKSIGGSGTVNQLTGLREYKGGSPPPPPPSAQSVSQTSEFPDELKPFISDVLGKAQAIQEKRETEGYIPFEGPQLAGFTPEQEQAFTGIQGLVGQGQGYFDPSTALAKSSAVAPTSEAVQEAMSPYTQNVVDIQQREALRQADVAQQQLGAQAVSAGGYGGSRMAILEAEQNRNTQQLLGDIQVRGQAAAYEDAQTRLAQQSGRELAASGQLMNLGSVAPQQSLKEFTGIEAIGAQKQAQSQQGLNIAKQQFQEEQVFPEQTLQQYQSVIRGFPLQANTYQQSQTTTPAPSYLQQAAGLGATGIGLAGAFGAFKAKGGLVSRMSGGQVDQTNGLGSIVVKKKVGGSFKQAMNESAAQAAIESNYNKELFQKVLNNEITPVEYSRLVRKYKDSAMAEMPEETDIDPEFLASRTIPKGRGTAMSPVEARMNAQERKAGLSSADQPITPSLSTEEVASRMRQSGNLDKRETSIIDSANLRKGAEKYDVGVGVSPSRDNEDLINRIQKRQAGDKEFQKSVSLDDLRKQVQAGMGGADAPVTPLTSDMLESGERSRDKARAKQTQSILSQAGQSGAGQSSITRHIENIPLVKDILNPAGRFLNKEVYPRVGGVVGDIGSSLYNLSGRATDYVTGSETPRINISDSSGLPSYFLGNEEDDRLNKLRKQLIAGQGGADQPNITESATAPAATASAATAPAVDAPAVSDEMPSNAEMAGWREGLKDFTPSLIDDQDKAPSVISTQIETLKVNKPAAEKTLTSFGKEISDLRKTLDERAEKKRTTAQRRKDSIKSDKFLAVSQMGLNILAQDGGQTFLQAIGKGSKNIIPTLMKLSREELKLAENLDDLDFETAKAKLGLTEVEFNRYVKTRDLDIKERVARAKEATVGATIGSGLSLGEVGRYVSSITTLPTVTLEKNKIIAFVDQKVRRDALRGLTPVQRADDSSVKESMRILLNDAKYMKNIFSSFTNQTGEGLPKSMGSGVPAGNIPPRPSATDTLTNAQKALRNSRSGTPVTR